MASFVARGAADAGIGVERSFRQVEGVDFLPLQDEWLDIVLAKVPGAEHPCRWPGSPFAALLRPSAGGLCDNRMRYISMLHVRYPYVCQIQHQGSRPRGGRRSAA